MGKNLKTVGHIQDTWEMGKYDENPMTHVHFSPEKDSRSSPTAQTREGTTLLMWFRLEECGLVKGSESQDLGNYQAAVTGPAGRHSGAYGSQGQ
jgi:hypothetical protein